MAFRKVLLNTEIGGPDSADSARQKWNANDAEIDAAINSLAGIDPAGYRELIALASDNAVASSVPADTGLQKAVSAGQFYRFEVLIQFVKTGTSGNALFGVTGPASPTFFSLMMQGVGTCQYSTSSYDDSVCNNSPLSAQAYFVSLQGVIQPSVNGLLKIRAWHTGAASLSIKAGSTLEVW